MGSSSRWVLYQATHCSVVSSTAALEHEVRTHRITHLPADDSTRKDVDHEGDVQPSLPGRDVGEIGNPELIGTFGTELPIDPVQRAWRILIADRGSHDLAAPHALNPQLTHQALDRAAGDVDPLAFQLAPHLVGAVHLQVRPPDPLDLRHQLRIAPLPCTAAHRIALPRSMPTIARRGDLQRSADRLDPEGISVGIHKIPQNLSRRSSSAWAKNAWPTSGSRWSAAAPDLAFEFLDPLGLSRRDAIALAAVDLMPIDPAQQRLARQSWRYRLDRRPQRRILAPMFQDHPDRTLPHLR